MKENLIKVLQEQWNNNKKEKRIWITNQQK